MPGVDEIERDEEFRALEKVQNNFLPGQVGAYVDVVGRAIAKWNSRDDTQRGDIRASMRTITAQLKAKTLTSAKLVTSYFP